MGFIFHLLLLEFHVVIPKRAVALFSPLCALFSTQIKYQHIKTKAKNGRKRYSTTCNFFAQFLEAYE